MGLVILKMSKTETQQRKISPDLLNTYYQLTNFQRANLQIYKYNLNIAATDECKTVSPVLNMVVVSVPPRPVTLLGAAD